MANNNNIETAKIVYHEDEIDGGLFNIWTSCSKCGSKDLSFADDACPECDAIIVGEEHVKC